MNNHKDKFISGLKTKCNLSLDAFQKDYVYCGGNGGNKERNTHTSSWKLFWKTKCGDDTPEYPYQVEICLCGHPIIENCYVIDKETKSIDNIIILGNCCIEKYFPESRRTCELCGERHRNRNDNFCNNCREKKNPTLKRTCQMCGDKHRNRNDNFCNTCRAINEEDRKELEKLKIMDKNYFPSIPLYVRKTIRY